MVVLFQACRNNICLDLSPSHGLDGRLTGHKVVNWDIKVGWAQGDQGATIPGQDPHRSPGPCRDSARGIGSICPAGPQHPGWALWVMVGDRSLLGGPQVPWTSSSMLLSAPSKTSPLPPPGRGQLRGWHGGAPAPARASGVQDRGARG